jgi:hypothetical protein
MPVDPDRQPQPEPDRLEVATDQAIAACGGDARNAVKALIVANEFLEAEVKQLQAAVSNGYARGRLEAIARIGMTKSESGRGRNYILRGVAIRCC